MSRSGSGARDQVARLLALVPLLHSREGLRVQEAADLLATTPAQVVKDLRVLWMCGLPGGLTDDLIDVDMESLEDDGAAGVIHVSNADYLSRPVRLSATEATALIVALRAVRDSSPEETRTIVDTVIAKLEVAVAQEAPAARIAVEPQGSSLPDRVADALQQALEQGQQVRLTYWVPSRDEVSDRTVDPLRLAEANGVRYLEAWCHRAEGRRVFRLDRVQAAEVLESTAQVHASDGDASLSVELFSPADDALTVTLRLAPPARWVPDYYAVDEVRHHDDGSLEVELRARDLAWLRQLVLRLAPHATVVAPASVAREVRAAVVAALALHG